jgi:hypothetical protein
MGKYQMSRLYGPVHRSLQDRFDTRRLAAAKDRIRARGHKLSHYLHREIMVMAMELLMAEPERFIAAAREAIVPELLRKAQGRSGRILSQSVTSPGPAGPENVGIAQ